MVLSPAHQHAVFDVVAQAACQHGFFDVHAVAHHVAYAVAMVDAIVSCSMIGPASSSRA